MFRNVRIFLACFFSLFFIFTVANISNVVRAQEVGGAGIRIQPAIMEDVADPGSTFSYDITVTNLTSGKQTYYLYTRDIVSVDGAGAPIFAKGGVEKTGFEISEWVSLSSDTIEIEAGVDKRFSVSIDVPESATPGGHFGGVFVSMEPPRLDSSGAAVGYEVVNIISLRVSGDVIERGIIRSFSTDNYINSDLNINFRANIENQGSVLIRPVGPLEIYNMFGSSVANLNFNDDKAGVFPGTNRVFSIQWEGEGVGFGRYTVDLNLQYGIPGSFKNMNNSLTFWVLPMNIIGPAIAILFIILVSIYIGVKLYIKRQLSGYAVSNRRLAQRRSSGSSLFFLMLISMLSVTVVFLIILLILFA